MTTEIFYDTTAYAARSSAPSAVALGFFDGVHLGHRNVISRCVGSSCERTSIVMTFDRSPASVLTGAPPRLLTTNDRKAAIIASLSADVLVFAPFEHIRLLTPEEFVTRVLVGELHAAHLFCGYHYRFGAGAAGDVETLRALCARYGVGVTVCDPVTAEGDVVSSTLIRSCIERGEIERADRLLGEPFAIAGPVSAGNHLGTTLGYPTLNLPIPTGSVLPRAGVYASSVTVDGRTFLGATNIGIHPTVGALSRPQCETFLLDYDGGDLYDRDAVCRLLHFVRDEQRFADESALRDRIARDCAAIRTLCRNN